MGNIVTKMFQQYDIRMMLKGKEVFFCNNDVCDVLGLSNPRKAIASIPKKDVTKSYTLTEGGKQSLSFINKKALIKLIMRSNKKEAEPFQDWVAEVILCVMETGSFSVSDAENKKLRLSCANEYKLLSNVLHDKYVETHDGEEPAKYIYSNECNLINKLVFGKTAKQWRDENPLDAKNNLNMRDFATHQQLSLLNYLEVEDSLLNDSGADYEERKARLTDLANQYRKIIQHYLRIE